MKSNTIKDNSEVSYWYQDRYQNLLVSRNRWFVIGLIALLLSAAQAFALVGLAPLKSVEPYVIQVDPESGRTMVVQPMDQEKSLTETEALTKAFMVKYIYARETYDPQDINHNYRVVRLMSSNKTASLFEEETSTLKSTSPVNRYQNHTRRLVHISSVSFIGEKTAQVRFKTIEQKRNSEEPGYWIATLSYRYINAPMDEGDRFENPLGFQVTSYRTDQEVVK